MLTIKNLRKRYGNFQALDGLNLEVADGELFGFVGPNGAGKTTTLKILAGLLVPDEGEVEIGGLDVYSDGKELRRRIGYVPDFFGVYDNLKVSEYMEFFASCYGITGLQAGGIVVFSFYDQIPEVLGKIVGGAFGLADNAGQTDGSSILNFSGISGGMTGYGMAAAIRSGVSRGVFSNEAGLGSLAVLHGMSEGKGRLRQRQEAQKQGMWAIFEVFFDTIIGCSLTAFLLLCVFPHNLTEKIDSLGGSGAVAAALAARFGNAGGIVTAACMVLFAFATILAWFYIGDQALGWLMRDVPQKRADKICILYHGGYLASVFLGCVSRMEAVWAVSDIFNGLMAVPNLAALVLLGRKVRRPER